MEQELLKNPNCGISSQEYYDKYYNPGSYHWEKSGKHAYSALLKSEKRKKTIPRGEHIKGLSKETVKCYLCGKKINKNESITKINGLPFHSSCATKKGGMSSV